EHDARAAEIGGRRVVVVRDRARGAATEIRLADRVRVRARALDRERAVEVVACLLGTAEPDAAGAARDEDAHLPVGVVAAVLAFEQSRERILGAFVMAETLLDLGEQQLRFAVVALRLGYLLDQLLRLFGIVGEQRRAHALEQLGRRRIARLGR